MKRLVRMLGMLFVSLLSVGLAGRLSAQEGHKSDHAMMMPRDDASYVQMMQMHHQQAVDMAKVAVERSQRADVKTFAQRVIDVQQKEIEELRRMQQAMKTGAVMHDDDHESMIKGEANKMMADLRQAQGAAFDRKFIDMMIPHHSQAVAMSKPATRFKAADVQAFARKVIDAQTKEIQELRSMRKKG